MTRSSHCLRLLPALVLLDAPASAETIDFEDRPASNGQVVISEEYADHGVHFATQHGATWNPLSSADRDRWRIEGTRGPTFLGFEGRSTAAVLRFDAPVEDFQLDVARGAGTSANYLDSVRLIGFREGKVVDHQAVYLGNVDEWKSLALSGEMDAIHLLGRGFFLAFRFGADNLQWAGGVETVLPADIDVKPGSAENPIQLDSRGVVPVVLYGGPDIDVGAIDRATLAFGPGRAPLAHSGGPHRVDHNGDGDLDLLLHYRVADAKLTAEDAQACVYGTVAGRQFEGCDAVRPVPAR